MSEEMIEIMGGYPGSMIKIPKSEYEAQQKAQRAEWDREEAICKTCNLWAKDWALGSCEDDFEFEGRRCLKYRNLQVK